MKKRSPPKDIEDLADMYYNQSRLKDREKYESGIQNEVAEWQEGEVKGIFNSLGNCEKIPTAKQKTFDFKIDESKLVFDVTTINPPSGKQTINGNSEWIKGKIQVAIQHIIEKDPTGFSGYSKGGVIYGSSVLVSITDVWDMLDKVVPGIMASLDLDFLVFVPQAASVAGSSSRELYLTKVFVKNQTLLDLFRGKLPNDYKITKI
jgi:hypothetical protein